MNVVKHILQLTEILSKSNTLRIELEIALKEENYELATWLRDELTISEKDCNSLKTILLDHLNGLKRFDLDYLFEYRFLKKILYTEPLHLEFEMFVKQNIGTDYLILHNKAPINREISQIQIDRWPDWHKFLHIRKMRIEEISKKSKFDFKEELKIIEDTNNGDSQINFLKRK